MSHKMEQEILQLQQQVKRLENVLFSLVRSDRLDLSKIIQMQDGRNIQVGKGTGTKIATAIDQKLGFFNATPVIRQSALTAANASTVDSTYGDDEVNVINNIRTRVNEIATRLTSYGLLP